MKKITFLIALLLSASTIFAGYSNFDKVQLDQAGSAALPALTFWGDANTGLYKIGADNLGLTVGGVKQVDISTSAISFTSAATFSGDLSLTSATTAKPVFTLANTNADAVGVSLILQKNSASPADNDVLGNIIFKGDDSTGTADTFASIIVQAEDVTTANEDTSMSFSVLSAGASNEILRLESGTISLGVATSSVTISTGNVNIPVVIGGITYYIKANTGE